MSKLFAWALLMIVTGLALRAPQPTAVKPSQHGTVTQQVANTTITVDYNRPVAISSARRQASCPTIASGVPVRMTARRSPSPPA
jgi:hypothetical protein